MGEEDSAALVGTVPKYEELFDKELFDKELFDRGGGRYYLMSAALETSGVDRFVYIHVEWNVGCAYEDEVVAQTSIKVTDRTGASAARTYKDRRMKIGPTVKRSSDECERTRNADDNARRSKSVQSIKNVSHKKNTTNCKQKSPQVETRLAKGMGETRRDLKRSPK